MGSQAERTQGKVATGRPGQSHIGMQISQEEQLGSKTNEQPRVPAWGNKASEPLPEKPVGVEAAGETPSLTGEVIGETHRVLEHTQTHLLRNQRQKA